MALCCHFHWDKLTSVPFRLTGNCSRLQKCLPSVNPKNIWKHFNICTRILYGMLVCIMMSCYLEEIYFRHWHCHNKVHRSESFLRSYTIPRLVKKSSVLHGTQRFITPFTIALHLTLSWVMSIQFMPPQPTSWRSILILCLVMQMFSFIHIFPPKPCMHHSCYHRVRVNSIKPFLLRRTLCVFCDARTEFPKAMFVSCRFQEVKEALNVA